jgi:hypothetical protein
LSLSPKARAGILIGVVAALVLGAALAPRVAQDPDYHAFADRGALAGIPNWQNVLSNIPFVLVGLAGLRSWAARRRAGVATPEHRGWMLLFAGFVLTGFGSAYYHWAPDDGTLFWDRLPMTLGFMALVAVVVGERISFELYRKILGPLVLLGAISVFYWAYTEAHGAGDLRLYALVQYGSLVVLLCILRLYDSRYTHGKLMLGALGCYLVAKVLESADRPVYDALGVVSGHALKHISAALGGWVLVHMYNVRKPSGPYATLEFDR